MKISIISGHDDAGCEDYGKRTDEKGRELYDKPVEIPEKFPQGRFSGNLKQSLLAKIETYKAVVQELPKYRQ